MVSHREQCVDVIGLANVLKLETAGLLPSVKETRNGAVLSDATTGGRRSIVWQVEARWCTDWKTDQ